MVTRVKRRQLSEADVQQIIIDAGLGGGGGSPIAGVISFQGRSGVVTTQLGDYTSSQISNLSTVIGSPSQTVTDALSALQNLKISDIVQDTSPQLGGNLDVNANDIVSTGGGNIDLRPDTGGAVVVQAGTTTTLRVAGNSGSEGQIVFQRNGSTTVGGIDTSPNSLDITTTLANADVNITPNGTGRVVLDGQAFPETPGTAGQVLTIGSPTTNLVWTTVSGGGPGSPQAVTSVFTRTGAVVAAASDYDASQIDNDSSVTGAFVSDALDQLDSDIGNVDSLRDASTNVRAFANTSGVLELRSDGNTDGETRRLEFVHQNQTLRGFVGYLAATSTRLDLKNVINGANVAILGTDNGGTQRNILTSDPDTITDLTGTTEVRLNRNAGAEISAQTVAAASGGLQVNNLATGAGLERVLTTSDLGGGGAGSPLTTITLSGDVSGSGKQSITTTVDNVAAANVAAGNLGSGVLPYAGTSSTSGSFRIPFLNTQANAAGNFGLFHDNGGGLFYNPSTNTLTAGTFSGSGASLTSLNADNISTGNLPNARLADMAGNTVKVRTAGTGAPQDLAVGTSRIVGNVAGVVSALDGSQVNTMLPNFTSGLDGLAPASGGGTTNFLRADATWADPLGGLTTSQFLRSDAADIKTAGTLTFNDNVILGFGNSNDAELFHNGSNFFIDLNLGDMFVRDGTTTRFTFDDNGDFTATGDVTGNSDIRLKENVEPITNGLEKVEQLSGYTYDLKDDKNDRRRAGVIAQEVEKVLPEVVLEDADGYKAVAYGNMVGLLIEAVKDLSAEVKSLKEEVAELKK